MGSARPVRRFDAHRVFVLDGLPVAEATGAPHALSRPFRGPSQESRVVPPSPKARLAGRRYLSWAFLPYDTCLGTEDPISMAADPSATSWRVRGLATPIAPSTSVPTGARSAGASLGFTLQGVDPHHGGTPLGASALLTLLTSRPRPLAGAEEGARSPPRRCSRDGSSDSDPAKGRTELPSWVSPLQRSLPDRPGRRL